MFLKCHNSLKEATKKIAYILHIYETIRITEKQLGFFFRRRRYKFSNAFFKVRVMLSTNVMN